ncbi:helix-turn-helix domain-containing protein [Sinomonas sp. ASV486]|uniref:helix-turn-helix transcriptional regulator n=1 Tax=Sinomonas sp. ASV486 TaxID=3051170 RepID=UPI0027DD7A8F|nr:helix-turn-helix domain-containing protein [Sinomonas sp. ASV486]MDQ4491121.1 helix-turn-helix domain-containing protein [Sinomonas sp. ASV486]
MAEQLLSIAQVAAVAGCSLSTVWRKVKRGELHPIAVRPRCTRYDPAEVAKAFPGATIEAHAAAIAAAWPPLTDDQRRMISALLSAVAEGSK